MTNELYSLIFLSFQIFMFHHHNNISNQEMNVVEICGSGGICDAEKICLAQSWFSLLKF